MIREEVVAKKRTNYIYGKFTHETAEFARALESVVEKHRQAIISKLPITHPLINEMIDMRNEIVALLRSWIGQKIIESRFGVTIPLSSATFSIESHKKRQQRSITEEYEPCEICGEKRITNYCHIVPRMMGGPSVEENYLYLCPTHHHLFDGSRLSPEEWAKIDFSSKSASAQAFAKKIIEPFITGEKDIKGIYGIRLEDFGMVARKRGLPVPIGDPRLKRPSKKAKAEGRKE